MPSGLGETLNELAGLTPMVGKDSFTPEQRRFVGLMRKAKHQFDLLNQQLANLQEIVDKNAEADVQLIEATLAQGDAYSMVDRYNSEWFNSCPYSEEAQKKVARSLLTLAEQFLIRNKLWQDIANGTWQGSSEPNLNSKVPGQ